MTVNKHCNVLRLEQGRLAWIRPDSDGAPQWLDDEDVQLRFRALLDQDRAPVCFAAPGSEVRLQHRVIRPEEKKHLLKSLPFMLEEELAEDVSTLHFATTELDRLEYGVAICSLERMQQWQEILAGYGVDRWLAEPLLLPWQPGEWCLLLEEGSAVLRTNASEGASMERELTPTLLASARTACGDPRALIIYGADQDADLTLVPEELLPVVQWRRGGLAAALLLADIDTAGPDLLQGPFAPRLPLGRWWQHWRAVAVLFACALGLNLLATWAEYRQLDQQNLALRGAIEQSYRQANPRGALVDAEKQLRRQLAELRGSGASSGFVSLVQQVGAVISQQTGTSIASLNYSQRVGELRLNILAEDYAAVERIREGIVDAGLEAVMESSSAQGSQVRARLRVGGGS